MYSLEFIDRFEILEDKKIKNPRQICRKLDYLITKLSDMKLSSCLSKKTANIEAELNLYPTKL